MSDPVRQGRELVLEMQAAPAPTPTLWWLGHAGFAVKFQGITIYIDPCLGDLPGRARLIAPPLRPDQVVNAGLVLCTHSHDGHMHPGTLPGILAASPRCRVILPRSAAGQAFAAAGVPYERMTTTDAGMRVEYVHDEVHAVIYSIPARGSESSPAALGYVIRFDGFTIYHAGDYRPYDSLVDRLRPYRISAALLPIAGAENPGALAAAQLAEDIGARWLVPMHYGTFDEDGGTIGRFVDHMLGHRPALPFKVFEPGEMWSVPIEAAVL